MPIYEYIHVFCTVIFYTQTTYIYIYIRINNIDLFSSTTHLHTRTFLSINKSKWLYIEVHVLVQPKYIEGACGCTTLVLYTIYRYCNFYYFIIIFFVRDQHIFLKPFRGKVPGDDCSIPWNPIHAYSPVIYTKYDTANMRVMLLERDFFNKTTAYSHIHICIILTYIHTHTHTFTAPRNL